MKTIKELKDIIKRGTFVHNNTCRGCIINEGRLRQAKDVLGLIDELRELGYIIDEELKAKIEGK